MLLWKCVFHGFLFIVSLPLYRPQVLDLDLSNFEKITQVASGHATGDWLVKFYAPWCKSSQKMAPVLEEVASELKGLVSVARVDVMSNRDVGTRFGISGFPTLKLFSQGHIYTFTGRRSVEEIVEFARGGFHIHAPEVVPAELGIFGELILVCRHAYKEANNDLLNGNFYTINVFCVAMPVIFGFLMLVVLFMPLSGTDPRSIDSDYNGAQSSANGRQSVIPLSRRARQSTSTMDSHSKTNKDK